MKTYRSVDEASENIVSLMSSAASNVVMPWASDEYKILFNDVTLDGLDLQYSLRSGDKCMNPKLSDETKVKLALGTLARTHVQSWNKLCATMCFEYNPIQNYNRKETETIDSESAGTDTMSGNTSDTGTATITGSNKNTRTDDLKDSKKIAGGYTDTTNDNKTHAIEGGYTDTKEFKTTDTTTESGTETNKHTDQLEYTDKTTHEAESYLKTTENLVAAYNSTLADMSSSGNDKTTITDGSGSIDITDNSGYSRQSKTIEGENGGYSDSTKHTPGSDSYTEDVKSFTGRTTETVHEENTDKNVHTYNGYKESDVDAGTVKHTFDDYAENGTNTGTVKDEGESSQTNISSNTGTSESTSNHEDKGKTTRINNTEGNIGVMSTQDMIKQEREVSIYDVIEQIFADIDKCLTIPMWI